MRATAITTEASASAAASAPSPVAQPAPDSVTAADVSSAEALIRKVNENGLLQTRFTNTPPPKEADIGWLKAFLEWLGKVSKFFGDLLEPIAPILPWLLYLLLFALVILLLSPLVRAFIAGKVERLFQRDGLKADAPWRPTAETAAALIEEIDALAEKGQYDEAVHLLLKRSVADLNAYRPDLVRKHYSARDIGKHPLLPEDARPAYAEITRWAEKSFFAGIPVGREGFEACRKAYVDFVASEHLPKGTK
ncbi:MAG: hypothetical protein LDL37_15115 [Asticcacaulis sp.]|uniref:hypothetical protein n=1 Tax=Asticcacaulis sp. TaxID=1872648 RepID=UPI0025C14AC0|nr:hypothetical protein [Asticcacaulis sp.]MCA1936774.1 hypothetical protein [Asticcacaulis sp.]